MSKFFTSIPVDVDSIKALIPKGAHINAIEFNDEKDRVEIHWEHDFLRTPYDHAQEYSSDALKAGQLPKGIRDLSRKPEAPAAAERQAEAPSAEKSAETAPEDPVAPPTEGEMAQKLEAAKEPGEHAPAPTVPTQRKKTAAGRKPSA